jgi:hypothetical protein
MSGTPAELLAERTRRINNAIDFKKKILEKQAFSEKKECAGH